MQQSNRHEVETVQMCLKTSYLLATGLNRKEAKKVQVVTLLIIIGEEAWEVFSTFNSMACG